MLAAFHVSVETLRESPLRTFLSTLGIVIGVASLVAVLSLGDGMEQFIRAQIGSSTEAQLVSIAPQTSRVIDGTAVPVTDTLKFDSVEVRSLRRYLGDSLDVGLTADGIAIAQGGTTQHVARVVGLSPSLFGALHVTVASGRRFSDADDQAALISRKAAHDLAPPGRAPLHPGDSILLAGGRYTVLGIIGGDQSNRAIAAIMPMAAARTAVASLGRPWIAKLLVRAPAVESVDPTRARVIGWLAGQFGPLWQQRATVVTNSAVVSYAARGLLLFKLFMAAITGISLIVGGIGIMNVLLAAVAERTREIGIRRAVGAARGHILAQFLAEAVTISGLGSAVGVVLGLSAAFGITALLRARTQAAVYAGLSPGTILAAVAATVLVGLSFGLYPALRASRLNPIDAIRHE